MKKSVFFLYFLLFFCITTAVFATDQKPLYWIDPMEPNVHYPGPGKSHMGMDLVPVYPDEPHHTDKTAAPGVTISPEVINNLGVRTAVVTQGDLTRQMNAVGYVVPNENQISHVHTYADGWIRELFVKITGETVQRDQKLMAFYSPTLVTAQSEYVIAVDSHNDIMVRAAIQKMQSLGISLTQIEQLKKTKIVSPLVDVYAPRAGVVTALNVREGTRITPETELMSITNLDTIWIMVEIYESQASWVQIGQTATARINAFPNQTWTGKVEYVYPQIDPSTRTLKVRLQFDNPIQALKPNMYADVILRTTPKHQVISIPKEALIRTGQGDRVIVAHEKGRFEPRAVTAGIESDGRIEISAGLKPGEQVVTSAQFLIDSEASLKGALDRMEHTPHD